MRPRNRPKDGISGSLTLHSVSAIGNAECVVDLSIFITSLTLIRTGNVFTCLKRMICSLVYLLSVTQFYKK